MQRWPIACLLAVLLVLSGLPVVREGAAAEAFPFGTELVLDAAPLRGSKRIPMIEIEEDGSAAVDLWCASLRAQASVGDGSMTITPGEPPAASCDPDRQARDADLLAALSQVTAWRRHGEVVELIGSTTLRFRPMTN